SWFPSSLWCFLLFPYTSLFRSVVGAGSAGSVIARRLLDQGFSVHVIEAGPADTEPQVHSPQGWPGLLQGELDWAVMTTPQKHAKDRKSTRLNSSHVSISYAVFC